MPTPENITLRVSRNGGAPSTGGITAAHSDVCQLSVADPTGLSQIRYEIYGFPPGYALPAGWTDSGNGVYTYESTGELPPTFTIPVSTTYWGKYMLRVTGNNATRNATEFAPDLIDERTSLEVVSPHGVTTVGVKESRQFDSLRGVWVTSLDKAIRSLDLLIGGGLAAPSNPAENGRVAIGSAGNLTYLAGGSAGDVLRWNGTAWVAAALSGLIGLSSVLSAGSTTTLGQTITWTGASANAVLGAGTDAIGLSGLLEVRRAGGGISGIGISDGGAVAGVIAGSIADGVTIGSFSATGMTISAAAGALNIAANTDIEIAAITGGFDLDATTYVEIGAGTTIELGAPTVSVPQGVLRIGAVPATTSAIGLTNNTGIFERNAANTQNARLVDMTSADLVRVGGNLFATTEVMGSTLITFDIFGTDVAVIRSNQLEMQGSFQVDWVTSAALSINNTNFLTSTAALSSFAQAISVTTSAAAVAAGGLIRTSRNSSILVARNQTNAADIGVLGVTSADTLNVGDSTNAVSVELLASTTISGTIGAANIWVTRSNQFEIKSTFALDFAGEVKISRADVDYITSTSGIVHIPNGILTIGSIVSSTGNIRGQNNVTNLAARNAANTGNIILVGTNSSDVALFGDVTVAGTLVGALTTITVWINAGTVATFDTNGENIATGKRLNFTEIDITRQTVSYITSASGLVNLPQSVLTFGSTFSGTGNLRAPTNWSLRGRNPGNTADMIVLTIGSNVDIGESTNVPLVILNGSTGQNFQVGGTSKLTVRTASVGFQSGVVADFIGNIDIQDDAVTRFSSTTTATRLNTPTGGTIEHQINAVTLVSFASTGYNFASTATPTWTQTIVGAGLTPKDMIFQAQALNGNDGSFLPQGGKIRLIGGAYSSGFDGGSVDLVGRAAAERTLSGGTSEAWLGGVRLMAIDQAGTEHTVAQAFAKLGISGNFASPLQKTFFLSEGTKLDFYRGFGAGSMLITEREYPIFYNETTGGGATPTGTLHIAETISTSGGATESTRNVSFFDHVATTTGSSMQSMERGLFIRNVKTAPTGDPTNGLYAWASGGNTFNLRGASNVVNLNSPGTLTLQSNGTTRLTANTTGLGFYTAAAVAQPSTTGEAAGFTAGGGTTATSTSTFTGNTGTKAYTVSDVVKHLKTLGLLAAS